MGGLMSRAEALALVESKVSTRNLRKHMLATEAVMRGLARRMGADEELWGLAGLVHDLDYDETAKAPERHAILGAQELDARGFPAELVHAVKAHAHKAPVESQLDKALVAVDPLTGFLVSCALIRPEKKLEPVDVQFVKNRLAEKGFSRAVSREQIGTCAGLGLTLEEFIGVALESMKGISTELGL